MSNMFSYTNVASFAGGFGFGYQVATAHNNERTVAQGNNYELSGMFTRSLLSLVVLDILNLNHKSTSNLAGKATILLTVGMSRVLLATSLYLGSWVVSAHKSNTSTYFDHLTRKIRGYFNDWAYTHLILIPSEALLTNFSRILVITEIAICAMKLYAGFIFEGLGTLVILAANVADQENKLPLNVSILMGRYLPVISALGLILTPNAIFLRLLGALLLANEVAMPALNLLKYPLDAWFQNRNAELHLQYPALEELEDNTHAKAHFFTVEALEKLDVNTSIVVNPAHINFTATIDLPTDNIDIKSGFEKHFKEFLVLQNGKPLSLQNINALAALKARMLDEDKGRDLLHAIRDGKHPELKDAFNKVVTYRASFSLPPAYYLLPETNYSHTYWERILTLWKATADQDWNLESPQRVESLKKEILTSDEGIAFITKCFKKDNKYIKQIIGDLNAEKYLFKAKPIRILNDPEYIKRYRENWKNCLKSLGYIATYKNTDMFTDAYWDEYISRMQVVLFETPDGRKRLAKAWKSDHEEVRAPVQIVIEDRKERGYKFYEIDSQNLEDWIPIVKHFSKYQMDTLVASLSGEKRASGNMARFDVTLDRAKQIIAYLDLIDKKMEEASNPRDKENYKIQKDEILIPLFCEGGDYCIVGIDEAIDNTFPHLFIEKERPVSTLESRLLHVLFQQRKRVNQAMYTYLRYFNLTTALNALMAWIDPTYKFDGRIDTHNYNAAMSLIGPDTGTSTTSLSTDQTVRFNPILVLLGRIIIPQYRYAFWSSKSVIVEENGEKKMIFSKDLLEGIHSIIEEIKPSLLIIKAASFNLKANYHKCFTESFRTYSKKEMAQKIATLAYNCLEFCFVTNKEILSKFTSYFDLMNRLLFLGLEGIFNINNLRYTSQSILSEITDGYNVYYTKQQYRDWWTKYMRDNPNLPKDFELTDEELFTQGRPNPIYLSAMLIEMGILKMDTKEKGSEGKDEKVKFPIDKNFEKFAWIVPLAYSLGEENLSEIGKSLGSYFD